MYRSQDLMVILEREIVVPETQDVFHIHMSTGKQHPLAKEATIIHHFGMVNADPAGLLSISMAAVSPS